MNTVTINGKTYNLPNGNVSVIGNIVYCNGKIITDCNEFDRKEIIITIQGDNNTVTSEDANITVNGNANNVSTKSGDIWIYGDANDVSAVSGDIEILGTVKGDCKTVSGDIKAKQDHNNTNMFIADVETEGIKPKIYKIKKKSSWFKELLFKIFGEE